MNTMARNLRAQNQLQENSKHLNNKSLGACHQKFSKLFKVY